MRTLLLSLTLAGLLLSGCSPLPAPAVQPTQAQPAPPSPTQPPATPPQPTALAATPAAVPSPDEATPVAAPTSQGGSLPGGAIETLDPQAIIAATLRPDAPAWLIPADPELADMTRYRLDVTLAPDLSTLTGHEQIRYTNRETVALDVIYLHLFPNLWDGGLQTTDVRVNGQPITPTLPSGDDILGLPLAFPLPPGDSVELGLSFSIAIPAGEGVGNYGEFAYQEGVLALAHFYPTVAVYDAQGWRIETPSPQGDVIYADASLYEVTFTAPMNLTVVASGATLDHAAAGEGEAIWQLVGGPMRDFNIAASADYQKVSLQVGDVTVNHYYMTKDAAQGQAVLNWTIAALGLYQRDHGPYPYQELDVVETATSAGGIEYPGMVVVASWLYRDPNRRDFFQSATAHEVAHQWWYNVVGNDQLNAPWLDEALAQYSTYLYYLDAYGQTGGQGFLNAMDARWARVGHAAKPIGLPVGEYVNREYGAIVYGRGPLFLVALREQIGADKMTEFLRQYYHDDAWGIATPAEFQTLAEAVSGQDLDALFQEWVYP